MNYDEKLISELKKLPDDYWDFQSEDVREYSHGIHNYPAMMVCPISRNILSIMKGITHIDTLLDPFSGSGTVLVEGMIANIRTIYGNDINPFALFLSKVKTKRIDISALQYETNALYKRVGQKVDNYYPQIENVNEIMKCVYKLDLTAKDGWGADAPVYLERYKNDNYLDIQIPQFKNVGYWFKPKVILLLAIIKAEIGVIEDEDIRNFVYIAFSEAIRFVSNRRNGEFKMFRMPVAKVETFDPDVVKEFKTILDRNIEKMNSFDEVCTEVGCTSTVDIFNSDAGELTGVPDESVDLVITSPPYGDSRTTVAYGEYSRLSLQWLDLYDLSEKEIMGIDKSLMGGTKYRNGFEYTIPSTTLKESLEKIKDIDLERAGDVYSFYFDLEKAIAAVARKTKTNGYQFWVVGNRTVKGELLQTDMIIAEIAESYQMDYVYTIDRNIINKVMPSQNSPTNEPGQKGTTMTNEHIVVLRKR
ncbi:MAG: DNA methylase [Ruminococcaceae bacterium]|nr:DNA methylase [Oscillospiraceae bacterium]